MLGVLFFVSFVSWFNCSAYWIVNNTGKYIKVGIKYKVKKRKNWIYPQGIETYDSSVYCLCAGQKCEITGETLIKMKSFYVIVEDKVFSFEKDKIMFLFKAEKDLEYNITCFEKTKRYLCFSKTCLYVGIGNDERRIESKKEKTKRF